MQSLHTAEKQAIQAIGKLNRNRKKPYKMLNENRQRE